MLTANQKFGKRGEQIAKEYLKRKNFIIIDHHYTCRFGEIDLIAQDNAELVFVEVKSRRSQKFGFPEEAITSQKLNRLVKAIYCYLEENSPTCENFRIDVVLLRFHKNTNFPFISHLKNVSSPPLTNREDNQY